jgi:CTP:molybdopterin cytidylyltransferase MocA
MFSSLQEASRWTGWLSTLTHWIISLGDQPHIETSTLCVLLNAARKIPRAFASRRLTDETAHPIILPGE